MPGACEAEAGGGAAIEEEWERCLGRHADAGWYPNARNVLDTWNERVLATDDPQDVERMMGDVLPLYTAHPDRPDVAAGLAAMKMKGWWAADLACWKAWVKGLGGRQTVDLRPLLGKIACPTLVVTGDLDFICGPAQAVPISEGVPGAHLEVIPDWAYAGPRSAADLPGSSHPVPQFLRCFQGLRRLTRQRRVRGEAPDQPGPLTAVAMVAGEGFEPSTFGL